MPRRIKPLPHGFSRAVLKMRIALDKIICDIVADKIELSGIMDEGRVLSGTSETPRIVALQRAGRSVCHR